MHSNVNIIPIFVEKTVLEDTIDGDSGMKVSSVIF